MLLRTKFYAIVGFQLALLFSLIAFKQYTLLTGERVLLKTVPVDPRDMFRGDYVALRYEISRIDRSRIGNITGNPGDTIYVSLKKSGRFWDADAITATAPTDGRLFLRGRVATSNTDAIGVQYGIESYFVPEGKGRELESAGTKGIVAEVAIDRYGRAALVRAFVDRSVAPSQTQEAPVSTHAGRGKR